MPTSMDILILIALVAALAYSLANGFFASAVAGAKGYSAGNWFWGGFTCGIIATVAIAGMPMKEDNVEMKWYRERQAQRAQQGQS